MKNLSYFIELSACKKIRDDLRSSLFVYMCYPDHVSHKHIVI